MRVTELFSRVGGGARVMEARPDITVKTTHNYEITHPYRWQCTDCQLIYGRFSKSIKPDESRCGKCGDPKNTNKGILIALHKKRVKDSQTPVAKISRMAASKPRDSPSAIFSRKAPTVPEAELLSDDEVEVICDVSTATTADTCTPSVDDSSDPEIEFIAIKMNSATLTD
ncbi:hypothetical protein WG66_015029 [Moniliophthora roreri]|uniref:Uncharacterized protein n=1 Tax=Moniliophthora roreri TaxID=221103 RepID=A0A0W0F9P6_MONRR|nr:hypothetical protein WG66_015029 [Moniliophthora roreri]